MWKYIKFFNDEPRADLKYNSAEENLVEFLNKENPEFVSINIRDYGYHSCTLIYKERELID